jgi:hypothetical protein
MIENMDNMDQLEFEAYFSDERTWMTVLSDGTVVPLTSDSGDSIVQYEERQQYSALVKAVRMSESDKQVC